MKAKRKTLIISSALAIILALSGVAFGFTYAYYERSQTVKDNLGHDLSMGAEGVRTKNYYLNTNYVWNTSDNAVFYALVWKNGDTSKFQWIKQTESGSNYLYAIDTVTYQKIRFIRFNSTNDVVPSTYADGSGARVYNRTAELTLEANKTYKITSWGNGTSTDAGGYWE